MRGTVAEHLTDRDQFLDTYRATLVLHLARMFITIFVRRTAGRERTAGLDRAQNPRQLRLIWRSERNSNPATGIAGGPAPRGQHHKWDKLFLRVKPVDEDLKEFLIGRQQLIGRMEAIVTRRGVRPRTRAPDEPRIEFGGAEDLLRRLYELSQAW